ncbi:hypothetical protein BDZ97DRAFT_1194277 [Flammula alnicola]|nr:hypothetical protein BDZ97DRAFT_1194277 [Flammula alnicola]
MLLEVVTLLSTLTPFGSADCTAHRHCSMVFIRQHSRQQRLPLPPNVGQQIDGIKSYPPADASSDERQRLKSLDDTDEEHNSPQNLAVGMHRAIGSIVAQSCFAIGAVYHQILQ